MIKLLFNQKIFVMRLKFITSAQFYVSILTMVTFTSCSYYPIDDPYYVAPDRQKENIYYVPTTPNAPFLSKKNDLGFSILRSSDKKFLGVETQAAYLPTSHFGIIASYASLKNKSGIE